MTDDLAELIGKPTASILDRPLTFTMFPDAAALSQRRHSASLRELGAQILNHRAAAKAELPFIKLAEFGDLRKPGGCLRHDDNVAGVTGIEGDYDAGAVSIADAVARLRAADIAALVHATPTHTELAPRWHVLVPLSDTTPASERERLCARLNGALGGILAPESFDTSRAYYFGAVEGRDAPTVELVDGRPLDCAPELDAGAIGRDGRPYAERASIDVGDSEQGRADPERAAAALALIPVSDADGPDGRDLWLRVGMALHSGFGGDEVGFELWDAWSQPGAKYDAKDQRASWRSFGRRKRGARIGMGTLFDIAKGYGFDPSERSPDLFQAWLDAFPVLPPTLDQLLGDPVEPAGDPVIARLNTRHAVVAVRGRTLITTERGDGTVDFGAPRDLHTLYANDPVATEKGKSESASARWLRSRQRRTYPDGVTFAPGGCSEGTLNLWRGWAVEPDAAASCDGILRHVREVVCRGDAEHARYVMGWLAHLVQRPDDKPGVAIVLRGAKGTGKDTLGEYLERMIGRRHVPRVSQIEHVVGKFNSRLENALLLHVQEGIWAGDKKAESVLKYLVTSDRVEIERKGIDSFSLPSVLRLLITANASWVVPASEDERRWAVFEVSDARRGDDAYWAALRAEMNGNGPAGLLHHLRTYDLSGFNVRRAPATEGLLQQKIASLRNVDLWWYERLNRGDGFAPFEDGTWEVEGQSVDRDTLRNRYLEWMKGRRFDGEPVEERHFGRRLRDMLPALQDYRPSGKAGTPRPRCYRFPVLSECREAFSAWIGAPIDWEGDG